MGFENDKSQEVCKPNNGYSQEIKRTYVGQLADKHHRSHYE